jgi:transposase
LVVDGGRGVRNVTRELDVDHETLRAGVVALRRERAAPGGPVSGDEQAELAPRRRVAELEVEKEILIRAAVLFAGDGAVSRGAVFDCIAADKRPYGVRRLCRVLKVSKPAFYDWSARGGVGVDRQLQPALVVQRGCRAGWWAFPRWPGPCRHVAEQDPTAGHEGGRTPTSMCPRGDLNPHAL